MDIRSEVEDTLRRWDQYEVRRGTSPIIDFDFCPPAHDIQPAKDRLDVYKRLRQLRKAASDSAEPALAERIDSHLAYLQALLGYRAPLDNYIRTTQGCQPRGWPTAYVEACRDRAIKCIEALGIPWGESTENELTRLEEEIPTHDAPEAIRQAAEQLEPAVREITGSTAKFNLTVETVEVDQYWSYWLDGRGPNARLRLNLRKARFTRVRALQFGLHEILGHALQAASISARCTQEDVPWVRILCVHSNQQVLFEGLAQALPLYVAPDNELLVARTRLDHYHELVKAELHLAVNAGVPIEDCARHAKARVPYWRDETIADYLSDRGANPLLRSYLWAYPAGFDWFVALADQGSKDLIRAVLQESYRTPLTPKELTAMWPDGPVIGGPGTDLPLLDRPKQPL